MGKKVYLNELVYARLVNFTARLMTMGQKPVSLGMAVFLAVAISEVALDNYADARERVVEILSEAAAPDKFDEWADSFVESLSAERE